MATGWEQSLPAASGVLVGGGSGWAAPGCQGRHDQSQQGALHIRPHIKLPDTGGVPAQSPLLADAITLPFANGTIRDYCGKRRCGKL
jgi:hypothetical protein